MTLTLRIQGHAKLANGLPSEFVLTRRGASIGRSSTSDWCLPDPDRHISSTHCVIRFVDGFYWLEDCSTNGTYLNGSTARMDQPWRIAHGDRILIGGYELHAALSGEAAAAFRNEQSERATQDERQNWQGWASVAPEFGAPPPSPQPQTPAADQGSEGNFVAPFGENWTPSQRAPDGGRYSVWTGEEADRMAASDWSGEAGAAAPSRPSDVWGNLAQNYVVDWVRGGFNQPDMRNPDPLGLNKADARADPLSIPLGPAPVETRGTVPMPDPSSFGSPAVAASRPGPQFIPETPPAPAARQADGEIAEQLLWAMQVDSAALALAPEELAQRVGMVMHKLVGGLTMMVEARARAKAQLGAEATSFAHDGNNPLKFVRDIEDAIVHLLKDPDRGYMDGLRAVEDAFLDLQAHQMATLKAMQGALKATLERFSPDAIRARAKNSGILGKLPGTREAALWKAYEREFSGVAQGSDEAFMDIFAKEFRKAYMDNTR